MNPASRPGTHTPATDSLPPATGNTAGTDVDPVCGMTVDAASPHRLTHAGREYVFCCEGCVDTFKADPERYLQAATEPTTQARHGREHAQHAHAQHGDTPGRQPPASAPTQWTCPMHPEI